MRILVPSIAGHDILNPGQATSRGFANGCDACSDNIRVAIGLGKMLYVSAGGHVRIYNGTIPIPKPDVTELERRLLQVIEIASSEYSGIDSATRVRLLEIAEGFH